MTDRRNETRDQSTALLPVRRTGPKRRTAIIVGCLTSLAMSASACDRSGQPLATADGHRLTVEDAARLIQEHSTLPADTQLVQAVAELWVDYTLLATRLEADTALRMLDVDLLVEQPLRDAMLARLSDEVVNPDTAVSSEELASRFAAEMPGAQATASQILLLFPPGATNRQRDSVRAAASSIKDEILAGAEFAAMARRFSADPGSASRGGSMGTFERGQMLAPVDSAVFRLRPGTVSEPVETQLGYHILRLEGLEVPTLTEAGDEFRRRIQLERLAEAEAAYIASLDSAAGLELADDALELARALAESSPAALSPRAAERPLLTWSEGAYTTGDFLELLRLSPQGFSEGVAEAPDAELEGALRRMGQQELLVFEAQARGFEAAQAEVDSVRSDARTAILIRAREIGLAPRSPSAADNADSAEVADTAQPVSGSESAGDRVESALVRIVSGQQQMLPLGNVIVLLREQSEWKVHRSRTHHVLDRLEALRSEAAGAAREGRAP